MLYWRRLMRSRLWKRAVLLAVALVIPACAYVQLRPNAAVLNPELDELSGLVRASDPAWLWGHNDSGDSARLFRVGTHGEDGGTVAITGAEANDWEAITRATWQGQPLLLIGDVGDNLAWRSHVSLYAVAEPPPGHASAPVLFTLNLHYPDGPRDCEGIAYDPISHDVLLLSKRDRPPHLYRVALPTTPPAPDAPPLLAEYLGPVLGIPRPSVTDYLQDPVFGALRDWTTDFAISSDGSFAVITTYKNAYRYPRLATWAQTFAATPQTIPLPHFRQTEAGGLSEDGRTLYIGSEKHGGFAAINLH